MQVTKIIGEMRDGWHYEMCYKKFLILRPIGANAKHMTNKNQSSGRRRNRTERVIQILEAVSDQTKNGPVGATKTTLMYEVFLNSNQSREHLAALTAYNLLHYEKAMGTYSTTKKGLRYLELWYKINDMANKLLEQQQMWMNRK